MIKRQYRVSACLSAVLLLAACAGGPGNNPEFNPEASRPSAATGNNPATATTPNGAAPSGVAPMKIALLLPLTGSQAKLGQAMEQAAQLALFDLGAAEFQLLPRDTGDTPEGAAKAADDAVRDGAQLVLGPIFAPSVRAAAPVVARAGINMIAFSNDSSLAGGNVFVFGFTPQDQIRRIVQYGAGHGAHRIGVLAAEGDYGDVVLAAYGKEAARDNVTTVKIARLPNGHAQMAGVIAAFARDGAAAEDAVLIAAGGEQAKDAASLLTQNGFAPGKVRRLGTALWAEPGLAGNSDLADAWFAAPSPDLRRHFESRYTDTYGQKPLRLASLAYDATALAAVLAKRSGDPRHAFDRGAIANSNGFVGVDGVFRFLPGGVAERGLAILTFHGSTVTLQDPPPQTFQAQ